MPQPLPSSPDSAPTSLSPPLRTGDPHASDDDNTARAADGAETTALVEATGRRALAIEADLSHSAVPVALFDQIEADLGPVSVLVHNASGWRKDSYAPTQADAVGRASQMVDAVSAGAQPRSSTRR